MQGIHPAGAQDQVRAADGLDRLFASELAAAVGAQGVGRVVFAVGSRLAAVVDVVGGVVEQRDAERGRFFRKHAGSRGIDGEGRFGLAFRLVHRRVGGGVDQQVG
ncbi:hypothetical protein D9M68_666420 [compost metagenome]